MCKCSFCGAVKEGSGFVMNECQTTPDFSKEGFIHVAATDQIYCNDCRQTIYDDIHRDEDSDEGLN